MMQALAWVLSLIMQPCYDPTGNWWIAILLFTVIVMLILISLSCWTHHIEEVRANSIRNLGNGGKATSKYFVNRLVKRQDTTQITMSERSSDDK